MRVQLKFKLSLYPAIKTRSHLLQPRCTLLTDSAADGSHPLNLRMLRISVLCGRRLFDAGLSPGAFAPLALLPWFNLAFLGDLKIIFFTLLPVFPNILQRPLVSLSVQNSPPSTGPRLYSHTDSVADDPCPPMQCGSCLFDSGLLHCTRRSHFLFSLSIPHVQRGVPLFICNNQRRVTGLQHLLS
jgi:hypothetical protein